eukprot:TRINITY_DN43691_c0_g1_i1.p1 TRINITY_DN43691_c0_g1~~TRINITY_DN43691_c0_g1_i1.p1  ORF type:complete len:802 (+),score=151.20 TRINITY_DN43691_c0_g1_i1:104-2509(+)
MPAKRRESKTPAAGTETSKASPKRFRLGSSGQSASIDLDGDEPPATPAKASESSAKPGGAAWSSPKVSPKAKSQVVAVGVPKVNDAEPGLPLKGIVMAFTGEMEVMPRVDAEEKAKAAGAKVMGSVSGNTNYLVVGSRLDDGRAVEETGKYRKMMELKEKGKKHPEVLTEAQFVALLPGAATQPRASVPPPVCPTGDAQDSGATVRNWVDKFAPKGFDEIVGNASLAKKLTEWLRDWDDVVLKGKTKRAAFKPGGGMPDNINARAALVSGPPGIGKTTTCRLVAKLHGGYEVLEYNASDTRSQKVIQQMADGLGDNRTLSFSGGLGGKKVAGLTKKTVIIMDEVDGMGAGDRGGMAALIKMIKKTKNPIICICNDAHSPKVKSLAFSCYDIRFAKPSKTSVAQRCAQIAQSQGLNVEENALEALAESCGSDMRMVLNQLQMLTKSEHYMAAGVKYMDMKEKMYQLQKDQGIMLSFFDAGKKLLNTSEGSRLSFRDRLDLFFVDHSIMGLLIQENYLNAVSKKPVNNELMERCAFAADLMATGDIIGARIRDNQEWSLLPDLGVLSCVYPAHTVNGFIAFPSFPSFLGKYSSMTKMRRLGTELQAHLKLTSTASRSNLPTSGYVDLLYKKLIDPLLSAEPDAIQKTVGILDSYGLRKEHLIEHLTEFRQHLGGDDLFKLVDPKIKSAMTREFNTGCHAVRVVIPKGKKRKGMEDNPDDIDDDVEKDRVKADEEEEVVDGSGDEKDAASSLVKIKNSAKAKAKGKAKARSASSSQLEGVDPSPSPTAKGKAKAKAKGKAARSN